MRAEIVATLDGNRVISILGHTSSSIEVDAAPPNDYRRTVALARKSIQPEIETLDGGSLVILAVKGGHRLGWLGLVAIDGVQETCDLRCGKQVKSYFESQPQSASN